jgi:hypothetical protein
MLGERGNGMQEVSLCVLFRTAEIGTCTYQDSTLQLRESGPELLSIIGANILWYLDMNINFN